MLKEISAKADHTMTYLKLAIGEDDSVEFLD